MNIQYTMLMIQYTKCHLIMVVAFLLFTFMLVLLCFCVAAVNTDLYMRIVGTHGTWLKRLSFPILVTERWARS